jgi:hypothetical protein
MLALPWFLRQNSGMRCRKPTEERHRYDRGRLVIDERYPQMDDQLFGQYHKAVVSFVKSRISGPRSWEIAQEVAQILALEALRQPKTSAYLDWQADQIRRNRVPGRLRRRALHVANELRKSATNSVDGTMVDQVVDPRWFADRSRLEAKMIADDLVRQNSWIAQVRAAYVDGCQTRAELASHLGISERRFFDLREETRSRERSSASS